MNNDNNFNNEKELNLENVNTESSIEASFVEINEASSTGENQDEKRNDNIDGNPNMNAKGNENPYGHQYAYQNNAQVPYYNNQAYQKKEPTRRVGTITMGLTLILAGLASVYSMINPKFNIMLIAKLTPLVLVFIGIEILLGYFMHKGERLKYDWLSGFICFILVSASIGFVVATPLIDAFGPNRQMVRERLSNEVYDLCYKQLENNKNIESLNIYVELEGMEFDKSMTVSQIRSTDYVRANLNFVKEYKNEAEFAADAKDVLDKIKLTGITFDSITFDANNGKAQYSLNINDKFKANMDIAGLTKIIERNDYNEDVDNEEETVNEELPEAASSEVA